MSSGGKGGAAARTRAAIPSSAKKSVANIKEITGHNHGEDEIYAMLKECSMDPNETAHKLLLLDAFHEVKKRRDRRRESTRKQDSQVQVNRAGRGNYSSRSLSHDAGGGRKSFAVRENVTNHISDKAVGNATLGNTKEVKSNEASSVPSPITDISNCPSGITSQSTNSNKDNHVWASGSVNKFNKTINSSVSKLEELQPFPSPVDSNKNMGAAGPRDTQQSEMVDSSASVVSLPLIFASGSQYSSLDPLSSPSQDFPLHNVVDSIRSEVGSNHILVEQNADNPSGVGKKQDLETMRTTSPRPSSDHHIPPQVIVPHNAIPSSDWKPKSTNSSTGRVDSTTVGSQPESQQTPSEATSELQRKLEEVHIYNTQQVVLPTHINVMEVPGFCFGSFDASFVLEMTEDGSLGIDKSTPLTESSDSTVDPSEVLQLSIPTVSEAGRHTEIKEDLSSREVEVLSSATYDFGESKQEIAPQGHQHPIIHTSSSYNYGYMLPMLNGQLRPSENLESQACSALPGFLMPQPLDPRCYYAQFYRSGIDSDGRSSPLNCAGAVNMYNGNVGPIPEQTSQSPQEGNTPLVISTASPVPLVTQAAGLVQSSISANQQHLPVFCQPTGIHLPHYPPFIPYAPYFSQVYVPPHGIHQLFSSGTFPQQPHSDNLYPNPHWANTKYSNSQNDKGSNASSNHVGVPLSYGPYSIPLANYTPSSASEALNSTSNEEVKGNHTYASEQQTEGSGVCRGQPAFAPSQPALENYTGVLHSAHAITAATAHPLLLQQSQPITIPIDMVGPTAGVYPLQQQHIQLNWPSNY